MYKFGLTIGMVALLLMGLGLSSAGGAAMTLDDDAQINYDNTSETGNGSSITIKKDSLSDYWGVFKFDLSSLDPADVLVTSATLELQVRRENLGTGTFKLSGLDGDSWDEATITSGNAPTRTPDLYTSVAWTVAIGEWKTFSFDVTSYVQGSVGALEDYLVSFAYGFPGSQYTTALMRSKEHGSESGRKASLDVDATVPEPTSLLVLGLGGLALLKRRG